MILAAGRVLWEIATPGKLQPFSLAGDNSSIMRSAGKTPVLI
jgi:hypothetical protein